MKKKKYNRLIKAFNFYYTELPAIAEYLEKKENEGYRLKELEGDNMIFERCEPEKFRYCAELFTGSSPEEFLEACASEGWEHVGTYNRELYIFRTRKHDAVDIMTDEKEKNKITGKKIFRQKNMWILFFFAVLRLIRTAMDMNSGLGINLPETDPSVFFSLALITFYVFDTFIRIFDCLLWKAEISSDTTLFSLGSTVKKRAIYTSIIFAAGIIIWTLCLWIVPDQFSAVSIVFGIIFAWPSASDYLTLKIHYEKTVKLKKCFIFMLLIAMIAFVFSEAVTYMKNESVEISGNTYNAQQVPIEVPDLGITDEYENDIYGNSTRFGKLYTFISDTVEPGGYLSYEILVSDYPRVRERYTDKILKEYEEFGFDITKVSGPETQWDYYYRITRGGDYEYDGFAVRDNTVLYLRWSVCCEKDFFELAYDKLFD